MLSNDGSEVIARSIEATTADATPLERLSETYRIREICDVIGQHGFQRVALQFPDESLADAQHVAFELSKATDAFVCVLADTTFGSCCVDTIAAAHANADLVVHFGHSCLSKTTKIATYFVFVDHRDLDLDHLAGELTRLAADEAKQNRRLVVRTDVHYHWATADLEARLSETCPNITFAHIDRWVPAATSLSSSAPRTLLRCPDIDASTTLVYIGPDSLTLTNLSMLHSDKQLMQYVPAQRDQGLHAVTLQSSRLLNRRYFLLQKCKEADVVGLLVGTLSVDHYLSTLRHLKRLLALAGKKFYTLSMGKPNPAKLGNFLEIDVFCLIACEENVLLDSREFLKPIVTPFEMEMAIANRGWGQVPYETGLKSGDDNDGNASDASGASSVDDLGQKPHFNALRGTLRHAQRYVSEGVLASNPDIARHVSEEASRALTARDASGWAVQSVTDNSAAAQYLQSRSYQGLDVQEGATPVVGIREGRSGIARGYTHEPGTPADAPSTPTGGPPAALEGS
ncbi:diphthamide biosynthesis protein [Caulochytrium protostelioides]|uniref:2-(3-amino-3-carboxypropyl)histidine synthase subunit 2 n=1 Tax=Caulochytrium protostelioides TaxID=1555241 RepID=A0A4P9WV72_9FUNG|nr:diphthamide biosynthesis protein [Caulochytrium protostelioides]